MRFSLPSSSWIDRNCRFAQSPISMSKQDWVQSKFPGMSIDEVLSEENYGAYRAAREEWQDAMKRALALGEISPEEAEAKKFFLEPGHGPLPGEPLYHVTTAKDAVVQQGLKSRRELSQDMGAGLGGGTSDTISFTTDLDTAMGILYNMREARAFARGDMTFDDLYRMAEKGEGAQRPWLQDWMSYHGSKEGEVPSGVKQTLDGYESHRTMLPYEDLEKMAKEGWQPVPESRWPHGPEGAPPKYTQWVRKLPPEKAVDERFQLFKTWSSFRDAAGGPLDPLYYLSDPVKLAAVPDDQLAILEFRAKPGAYGHQVSALGEWRTYAGDAVELVGEVPDPFDRVAGWLRSRCRFAQDEKKDDLGLFSYEDDSIKFETGLPVEFPYIRMIQDTPFMGEMFQQHIDPAGRYMSYNTGGIEEEIDTGRMKSELGSHQFENPLVLQFNTSGELAYDDTSWKARLHRHYNKTGNDLAEALVSDGYDGIVTVRTDTDPPEVSEIVDLKPFIKEKKKKAWVLRNCKFAQDQQLMLPFYDPADYTTKPTDIMPDLPDYAPEGAEEEDWVNGFYHVTSNLPGVLQSGELKSRSQLDNPIGLGGGGANVAPNKVSVTHSYQKAVDLAEAMRFAASVAHGQAKPSVILWDFMQAHAAADDIDEYAAPNLYRALLGYGVPGNLIGMEPDDGLEEWLDANIQGGQAQYEFMQAVDEALLMDAEQLQEGGSEPGSYAGFTMPYEVFSQIDPANIGIVEVMVRRDAKSEHVPGEMELRFDPQDVMLLQDRPTVKARRLAQSAQPSPFESYYPPAESSVGGLAVLSDVPNMDSIGSSLGDYDVLPGIRQVDFSLFTQMGDLSFYSKNEQERTEALAEEIRASGAISPLIVVVDQEGPYVLEGGHRFDALRMLGIQSFPAIVVVDNEAMGKAASWIRRNCRFAQAVPTGNKSWRGGEEYQGQHDKDLFVHFTTPENAANILQTKQLGQSDSSVFAISLSYGHFFPEVQTTHTGKDLSGLVGVIFSTPIPPKVGYGEEVVWDGPIPIENPEIISADDAQAMLGEAPAPIGEDDQVVYQSRIAQTTQAPKASPIENIANDLFQSVSLLAGGQWEFLKANWLLPSFRMQKYGYLEMQASNVRQEGDKFYAKIFWELGKYENEWVYPEGWPQYNPNEPAEKPYTKIDSYDVRAGHELLSFRGSVEGWKPGMTSSSELDDQAVNENKDYPGGEEWSLPFAVSHPGEFRHELVRIGEFEGLSTPYEVAQYIKHSIDKFYLPGWDNEDGGDDDQGGPLAPEPSPAIEEPAYAWAQKNCRFAISGQYIRYVHQNGLGLMNNQGLDRMRLDDDEEFELIDLLDFGLQQPIEVPAGAVFAFTEEGAREHARLIELLTKASKTGVRKEVLDPQAYDVVWQSQDGQVALLPKQETTASWLATKCRFAQAPQMVTFPPKEEDDDYSQQRSEEYFMVGHSDEDDEGHLIWVAVGNDIQSVPEVGSDGRQKTHGTIWGHDFSDKTWKGRYDGETGEVSIVGPGSFSQPPQWLVDALVQEFKPTGFKVF